MPKKQKQKRGDFQYHPSDTAVTLTFDQGHRNWHKSVKLNRAYRHEKFDGSHTPSLRKRPPERGLSLTKSIHA